MQVSQILNPIYMPAQGTISAQWGVQPLSGGELQPGQNPYNTRPDSFITKAIFGGMAGAKMGHVIFDQAPLYDQLGAIDKYKPLLKTAGMNVAIDAAVYGSLSLVKQGIGMAAGKQDAKGALANVSTDLLLGASAGVGASAGGTLVGYTMRALQASGAVGTAAVVIGGMVGAAIGANLFESMGLRDTLVQKFGSEKSVVA